MPDDKDQVVIKGSLGNHQIVQTKDGVSTLFSEFFDEACHSLDGAKEETHYIYLKGCELERHCLSLPAEQTLAIFEVGLGAGVGLIETHRFLKEKFPNRKLHFFSVEIDQKLTDYIWQLLELPPPTIKKIDDVLIYSTQWGLHTFEVIIGDARKTIPSLAKKNYFPLIHAYYQDAFSPKRNMALWTTEWFKTLMSLASPTATLSTYSATNRARKAMMLAGLEVFEAKGHGAKRSSTRACSKNAVAFFEGRNHININQKLQNSPTEAFMDADLLLGASDLPKK